MKRNPLWIIGIACPNCSAQNPVNAEFCTECGNKFGNKIDANQTPKLVPTNKCETIQQNPAASDEKHFAPEKKWKGKKKNYVMEGLGLIGISIVVFIIFTAMDRISFWAILIFFAGLYYIIKGLAKEATN